MKVKTLSPRPWSFTNGGIETQIRETTRGLQNLGVDASYFHFDSFANDFQLLHLFAADYTFKDIATLAKGHGKKLCVSSVYFSEHPHLLKLFLNTLDRFALRSYFQMKRHVLESADIILPNCHAELNQVSYLFNIDKRKMRVVPNGVDEGFKSVDGSLFYEKYGLKDFVLCVSRIDSRKNIHKLIQAVLGTDLKLVLIGMLDYTKSNYGRMILDLVKQNPEQIFYLGSMSNESDIFRSAYGACHIHALPSRLETPGLSNLESALAGKKVVSSDLSTVREYLEDYAFYCNPNSVESIRKALLRAYNSPKTLDLQNHVSSNFLWKHVAEQTYTAYSELV